MQQGMALLLLCVLFWGFMKSSVQELFSLGESFTFHALPSFRLLLIKCISQQFVTDFYSLSLRSLLFKTAPEIVI